MPFAENADELAFATAKLTPLRDRNAAVVYAARHTEHHGGWPVAS